MISSITPGINTGESAGLGNLGTDLFLKLLVSQLQNQNPMEPMDSSALLQQTSQFANVEAVQKMSALQSSLAGLTQFGAAANMIGREITADDEVLGNVTGIVSGVRATDSGPVLVVDGREISIDDVTSVSTVNPTDGESGASTRQPAEGADPSTPKATDGG